eukprot:snap_masked-scaffold_41-processed-gene-0.16-mRNA-1 protein AED:1.00 eAED:1.00 QI:0/0/0/0/1/1/6/0/380
MLVNTNKNTSLKVFNKFTRRDIRGKLVFENIISKECFKEWVKTRRGKLKNPRGSFRRTIYAHLRGADGRLPFAPDVESSILQKLREVLPSGKPIDPFKPILGNRKQFKRNKGAGWLPAFQYPYGHHEKTQAYLQTRVQSFSIVKPRDEPKKVNDLSSLENFLKMSQKEMMEFLEQGKQVSRNFNFSAVAYLVRLMSSHCYFLSKDFILPPQKEQLFKQECIFFFLFVDFLSIYPMGNGTFGNIPYVIQLAPSLTEFFNTRREVLPLLRRNKCAWFRGTVLIKQVRYLFKAFIEVFSPGVENVFFQVEFNNPIKDETLDRLLFYSLMEHFSMGVKIRDHYNLLRSFLSLNAYRIGGTMLRWLNFGSTYADFKACLKGCCTS